MVAITSSDGAHSGQQPGVQITIKELGGEVRSGDPAEMKNLTHFVVCGEGDCSAKNMIGAPPAGGWHFDVVRHTWVLDCHQVSVRVRARARVRVRVRVRVRLCAWCHSWYRRS